MLLREGKITREQFEDAGRQITRGKRLGKILVEMQAIGPKDLWNEVRHQVQEIAYSILAWDSGSFQFMDGEQTTGENITTALTVPELLLEGLRRIRAAASLQQRFPEGTSSSSASSPPSAPRGCTSRNTRSTSSSSWTARGAWTRSAT